MANKSRGYCTCCSKRLYHSHMVLVRYPLIHSLRYHCYDCLAEYSDNPMQVLQCDSEKMATAVAIYKGKVMISRRRQVEKEVNRV